MNRRRSVLCRRAAAGLLRVAGILALPVPLCQSWVQVGYVLALLAAALTLWLLSGGLR